jgi:hypothetical protein
MAVALAGLRDRPQRARTPAGLLGLAAGLTLNPFFHASFLYQHAVVKVLNRAPPGRGE